MSTCWLGSPTETPELPGDCICQDSCESHIHETDGHVLCLHDGENDHGHCPQANTDDPTFEP